MSVVIKIEGLERWQKMKVSWQSAYGKIVRSNEIECMVGGGWADIESVGSVCSGLF